MRTYPVVNLAPALSSSHMGQAREFEVLSDQVLARICMAVDAYNAADTSWSSADAAAGERTQRDSTATIQSVLDSVPPGLKNAAIWEIRKYCDGADAVLDTVKKPGPGTPPTIPPSQDMVPSTDRARPPEPPPSKNDYPPVATGQPGPGRGAFGHRRSIPTGQPGPGFEPPPPPSIPFTTGSEPELPPPPPPPTTPPPSVATPSVGCWYVMGKGYMWGERPSGGESTGLNQKDCEDLIARDQEVRSGQPPVNQQASCDPFKGQLYDPRTGQCRSSVSSLPNLPFGSQGPSGTISATGFNSGAGTTSFMGSRRVALRGVQGNGNLDWWGYQRAFLPQLFFARRRASYATLGGGKSASGFLGEARLSQQKTVDVWSVPFGANALALGPSSWGFGAPNAIPIQVEWPATVRPGRPNW